MVRHAGASSVSLVVAPADGEEDEALVAAAVRARFGAIARGLGEGGGIQLTGPTYHQRISLLYNSR